MEYCDICSWGVFLVNKIAVGCLFRIELLMLLVTNPVLNYSINADRKPPGVGRGRGRGDVGAKPGGRGIGRGQDDGGRGTGGRGRGGIGGKGGNKGSLFLSTLKHFFSSPISRDTNMVHASIYWQVGAVAVADADRHMGECRFLRPVPVLHRLLRT